MLVLKNLRAPCRSFSRVAVRRPNANEVSTITPVILHANKKPGIASIASGIKFTPNLIQFDLGIGQTSIKNEIRDLPLINKIIENPVKVEIEINEIIRQISDIKLPETVKKNVYTRGKQPGLIVIRRKKMKKHKRKKLKKRMKFVWAKVKQRREVRKEKAFQAELITQIKEAEKFSAEEYVAEKLRKATEVPLPRYWKGKRLPQFIIKQLVEEDAVKRANNLAKMERIERYRHTKL